MPCSLTADSGKKGKKTKIGKISASEVSPAVVGGGLKLRAIFIDVIHPPKIKGAVSQNSDKVGNYKMPVKLRET